MGRECVTTAILATGNIGLGCKNRLKEQVHYYMFEMDVGREEFDWEAKNLLGSYNVVYCFWRNESWVMKKDEIGDWGL